MDNQQPSRCKMRKVQRLVLCTYNRNDCYWKNRTLYFQIKGDSVVMKQIIVDNQVTSYYIDECCRNRIKTYKGFV